WVAMICILVGGIGVMNILLVSVRERRREIGIMKALGTRPGLICGLFLLEALLYAVVGGIAGVGIGIGIIAVAGNHIGLRTVVRAGDCLMVVLAAMMVGLAFGVLPACRASAMNPVDALRDE
ncbi:MAG: FtsX-like permease family protein, partial [Clostridia bacterium]|nr:FtsX-like permease family protein [Clostridia bacterium]